MANGIISSVRRDSQAGKGSAKDVSPGTHATPYDANPLKPAAAWPLVAALTLRRLPRP
jgi:hypothetical protein